MVESLHPNTEGPEGAGFVAPITGGVAQEKPVEDVHSEELQESLDGKEENPIVNEEFFEELPQEVKDNLKGDYTDPYASDHSPEAATYALLHKITDNLLSPDPEVRTEAGRLLAYFRSNEGQYLDKIPENNRAAWKAHIDQVWQADGQAANEEYKTLRNQHPETQDLNLEVSESRDQVVDRNRLLEQAKGFADEAKERATEAAFRIKKLNSIVKNIPEACQQQAAANKESIYRLKEAGVAADRIEGMELIGRMIDKVAARPEIAQLAADLENAANQPLFEPSMVFDLNQDNLDSIGPDKAQQYVDGFRDRNDNRVRGIIEKRNGLVKRTEKALKNLTNIASSLHRMASNSEGTGRRIIEIAADNFDRNLSDALQVRRLQIEPGHQVTDEILMHAQATGIIETHDQSKNNTVATVDGASYSLNPELSLSDDSYGDIIQEAVIEVYRYKR